MFTRSLGIIFHPVGLFMAIDDNERKACDAVIRSLEELLCAKRSNAYSPEDNGIGCPVEYAFEINEKLYAVEHTIVQAFEHQIETDVDFEMFVTPITDALDNQLPAPGKYSLCFQIHPTKGLNKKKIKKAQTQIIEWVQKNAAELHAECPLPPHKSEMPQGYRAFRKGSIEGIEAHLYRETGWYMPPQAQGRLFPARFAPKDYERLRCERMNKTMNAKLGKLQSWKIKGARSVLVLENRDIAISNHVVIQDAANQALQNRTDRPDEVWLVDTALKNQWTVWCLIRDGISFPDEDSCTRFRYFSPSQLLAI